MKTKALLVTLIAIPVAFASCSKKPESAAANPSGDYPLTTCVVSGEELGSMGDPIVYDHEGTTVKFCCKACIKDFKKDPDTYLAKLK
jgi:YHS domain-containing protein